MDRIKTLKRLIKETYIRIDNSSKRDERLNKARLSRILMYHTELDKLILADKESF